MKDDTEDLRQLNMAIGRAQSTDRAFFEETLAPAFAMRRANGSTLARDKFLSGLTGAQKMYHHDSIHLPPDTTSGGDLPRGDGDGKSYENHRVFVRESAESPWRLLSWANEAQADPSS